MIASRDLVERIRVRREPAASLAGCGLVASRGCRIGLTSGPDPAGGTPTAVAQRRRLRSAARSGRARMSRAVNKRTCVPDRDSGERVPTMRTKKTLSVALMLVACVAAFLILSGRTIVIGQAGTGSVAIDNDDIGGVVSGQNGPEAGVWVIA